MNDATAMKNVFLLAAMMALTALPTTATETAEAAGAAVHMVVTAEAKKGGEERAILANEVQVYQGRERVQATDWVALQGEHAGLQLFIVLDDASSTTLGTQFEDLRKFIVLQAPATMVGIAYMRDGGVDIAQNLTSEHAAAAKALRLPMANGGAFSSIYLSITDLIKRWPESPMRRELLVISDGIDRFGGSGPANPYVDQAIESAQKAGVIVYSIYASGPGHYARNFWRLNWGQNYLSEVAEQTGGEAFYLGFETPVSFAPYLEELMRRLNHQYLLAFLAKPVKKSGLEPVKVRTEIPGVELVAASRVWVPASE